MASVTSPVRDFLKPILFKILGKRGYLLAQVFGKIKDIKGKLVEEKEMELLPRFVKEGDDTLDVGANYGYYTHRLASYVGEQGKVFAFEPVPFTHRACDLVMKYFRLRNSKLFPYGVGNENKKVQFNVPVADFGGISAGLAHISGRNNEQEGKETFYNFNKESLVDCEIVKVDDFLLPELKNLSFVKIDIEGAEYFALQGMKNTLEKFRPVVLVEIQPFFLNGYNIKEESLKNFIKELGYKTYLYDEKKKKLTEHCSAYLDRNYILIPETKAEIYQDLIEAA